ncbi:MAG TPA: tetrathionate reductase family octaheme c-type cytochrome [Vicinamibacteria bacterium]|nr:tetrathionate reductase family octaheme c-type cytochrome [Vicinamibacteria bacterium]
MRKIFAGLAGLLLLAALAFSSLVRKDVEPSLTDTLHRRYAKKPVPSVDHTKFSQLQRRFASPQQVTEACISCHNGRQQEVMRSSHWNWERAEYIAGRGVRYIGKKNLLNNFCIGVAGSHEACDKCHIGYGWTDAGFDFGDARNVDCLACHDNTSTYVKANSGAGNPDPTVDLTKVAQHVGRPQRTNCGTCHFFSGGGNNVKHGDLEMALFDTTRQVDVHMGSDGADMSCVDCHTAEKHQLKGKLYSISSMNRNRVQCEDCHTATPHADGRLNMHTLKVACQSCHIPTYAKVNSTKLRWDWSTAGRLRDGKPFEEKDALGDDVYMSIKGSFRWGRQLKPEYAWFDGTASHYLLGDRVEQAPVKINRLFGSYAEPDAKIVPVKVHRARQPFDEENRLLVQPKLAGTHDGDGALWRDFDWQRSASEGMKLVGLPYSGKLGFVETEMIWPINHMVAPKGQAVGCAECHTRRGSRLAGLTDFYLPGRDRNRWVDGLGSLGIGLALAGVVLHAGGRAWVSRRATEGSQR